MGSLGPTAEQPKSEAVAEASPGAESKAGTDLEANAAEPEPVPVLDAVHETDVEPDSVAEPEIVPIRSR